MTNCFSQLAYNSVMNPMLRVMWISEMENNTGLKGKNRNLGKANRTTQFNRGDSILLLYFPIFDHRVTYMVVFCLQVE